MAEKMLEEEDVTASWLKLNRLAQVERRDILVEIVEVLVRNGVRFCELPDSGVRSGPRERVSSPVLRITKVDQARDAVRPWKRPMHVFLRDAVDVRTGKRPGHIATEQVLGMDSLWRME